MGSIAVLSKSTAPAAAFPGVPAVLLALWLLLACVGASIGPASAQSESGAPANLVLPEVLSVRISTTPQRARLIFDLSGRSEFAIVSFAGPDRVAIDVRASAIGANAGPTLTGTGLIGSSTLEQADAGRVRATLLLAQPGQVQQAYMLDAVDDQPARLVVDLIIDTPEAFARRVASDLAASQAPPDGAATAPVPEPADAGAASDAPQIATGRPLVVLDPGHGGFDSGAEAANGLQEKNIVLAFTLKLQELLVSSGRFDVALTRQDDTYLTLDERVALARQNKADLFISLHADAFEQEDIRGASVYTRDEQATDILAKVLADTENKADIVAGLAPPEAKPVVVDILVDLMRREMRRQSFIAGTAIVDALKTKVAMRRFPVRQADFFVLQAPDVPSVLIELGYMSNDGDISNLGAADWRDKMAAALAQGISDYFDGLKTPL